MFRWEILQSTLLIFILKYILTSVPLHPSKPGIPGKPCGPCSPGIPLEP